MVDSPWPDEPMFIRGASPRFAYQCGGDLTRALLSEAREQGFLDTPLGQYTHVDVRCTYREAGETQHYRDAWHFDRPSTIHIWVDGESPTEYRESEGAPPIRVARREWHTLVDTEHRCPPQMKSGWRYFMRIANVPVGHKNSIELAPA